MNTLHARKREVNIALELLQLSTSSWNDVVPYCEVYIGNKTTTAKQSHQHRSELCIRWSWVSVVSMKIVSSRRISLRLFGRNIIRSSDIQNRPLLGLFLTPTVVFIILSSYETQIALTRIEGLIIVQGIKPFECYGTHLNASII